MLEFVLFVSLFVFFSKNWNFDQKLIFTLFYQKLFSQKATKFRPYHLLKIFEHNQEIQTWFKKKCNSL